MAPTIDKSKGVGVISQSKFLPIVGIALFCVLMGAGQMLFKLASMQAKGAPNLLQMLKAVSFSLYFWTAGVLYAAASILWVMILTRVPLSVAYPVTSLTIVIVPLASWFFFGDTLSLRLSIGMAAILFGVWLIATR
jgi:drug/metabolite transporter (DMT)-like permease